MNTSEAQKQLFNYIIQKTGDKTGLHRWLKSRFGLKQASIYRRLSGDKLLDFNELRVILEKYQIPISDFLQTPDDLIHFHLSQSKPDSYKDWLRKIDADFSILVAQDNCKMYYTSTENPIFYYFHFDALLQFKFYIWSKTMWNFSPSEEFPFILNDESWDQDVINIKNKILSDYTKIPSIDFWTPNLMSNILNQIQYYLGNYHFEDRHDVLILCEQLRTMLTMLKEQAITGKKVVTSGVEANEVGDFDVYYNEILHTNNNILLVSDIGKTLFSTFGNPNTIHTRQVGACNYFYNWLHNLKQYSVQISGVSTLERLRVFKKMEEKINKAERLFKGMM